MIITLSNALGASLGSVTTYTITINDNDAAPQASISFRTTESSSPEKVAVPNAAVVTLDRAASQTVTVTYSGGGTATLGTDYTLASTSLVFQPGEIAKPIPLTVLNDPLGESDETVIIALTNVTGAALNDSASHTLTILDNDPPTVTVAASDAQAGEFGRDTGTWTITRTRNMTEALTVRFSISGTANPGTDYQLSATSGNVTLPASAASVTITLTPLADAGAEGSETAIFVLSPDGPHMTWGERNGYRSDNRPSYRRLALAQVRRGQRQ